MTFEEMMDNVIRRFGFEHEATVMFAGCENMEHLKEFYELVMMTPVFKEE